MSNRYRKGFEQSQKRIDDLRHLVVNSNLATFSNGNAELGENALYFADRAALPNDYLFLVSLRAQVLDACEPTTFVFQPGEDDLKKFQRIDLTPPVIGYVLTEVNITLFDDSDLVANNTEGLTKDDLLNPTTYSFGCFPVTILRVVASVPG